MMDGFGAHASADPGASGQQDENEAAATDGMSIDEMKGRADDMLHEREVRYGADSVLSTTGTALTALGTLTTAALLAMHQLGTLALPSPLSILGGPGMLLCGLACKGWCWLQSRRRPDAYERALATWEAHGGRITSTI